MLCFSSLYYKTVVRRNLINCFNFNSLIDIPELSEVLMIGYVSSSLKSEDLSVIEFFFFLENLAGLKSKVTLISIQDMSADLSCSSPSGFIKNKGSVVLKKVLNSNKFLLDSDIKYIYKYTINLRRSNLFLFLGFFQNAGGFFNGYGMVKVDVGEKIVYNKLYNLSYKLKYISTGSDFIRYLFSFHNIFSSDFSEVDVHVFFKFKKKIYLSSKSFFSFLKV